MTPDPHAHLDDEAVSAVVDGEATEDESRHVTTCGQCSARVSALRAVAAAVAAPVPPLDPARLDAAVAAALSAQNVVPISVARRRPVPAWIGAAAAVIAVVAAVGLLGRGGSDEAAPTEAEGGAGAAASDQPTMAMEESAGTTDSAPEVVDGGDVGELVDADLRAIVDGAIAQRETSVVESTESVAGGTDADAMAPSTSASAAAVPIVCEPEVRAGNPDLGGLLYVARGTYDGAPVEILVFDAGADRWAYVTTVDGCEIRSSTTWRA